MTQAAASGTITIAGLVVGGVTNTTSSTVTAGSVISESPSAGVQVTQGSAVSLVISLGPPVSVPNVVGSPQSDAMTAITGAGLVVAPSQTRRARPCHRGQSSVKRHRRCASRVGIVVTLVVSTGLPPVTVPNVVGSTQPAATTALTNAGLTVGNEHRIKRHCALGVRHQPESGLRFASRTE